MRSLSGLLGVAIIGFGLATAINIHHGDYVTAAHLAGWTFALLAVLAGFVWPNRCKVETRLGKPCRLEAYGFLFGCRQFHSMERFLLRVRMNGEITRPAQRRVADSHTSVLPMPTESEPVKVSVENDIFSVLGFWIAVVSAITGIAQVVLAVRQ